MTEFLTPVDIANRGLQHCGQTRIDATLGFTEPSKAAAECGSSYGKLRRAELQRNTWRFAIRRTVLRAIDATTMLLRPALWASTTTYFVGSIVIDQFGTLWISQTRDNLGNDPLNSSAWAEYFGPMTVSAVDSTTSYFAGELVYTAPGDGTNRVYLSLINGNTDVPATATAWSATATYFRNQVVTKTATAYMSRIDLNLGQDPATTFVAEWASVTTYGAAAKATGTDGVIYSSIAGGNVGHDPISSPAFWTNTGILSPWDTTFVGGAGSLNWLQIGGAEFPMGVTLAPITPLYPINSGPSIQSTAKNFFRLPAGFLRKAPVDPKAGAISYLGASWGLPYDDWNFENAYITSAQSQPITLAFVADTVDVTSFDDMFCEGLGARIGFEVCEALTQSTSKKSSIAQEYDRFMGEARKVNAILIGSEQPPVDDYISCRG
jgi:hypothetical protein